MPYIGNPIYQSAFVTDTFTGDGTTTAFTMSVAPAGTTNVLVVISGVVQDPSTYGVAGNTITFSAAPPSGTGNISCRYLGVPVTGVVSTAYRTVYEQVVTFQTQSTFIAPSYTVGFLDVYRNGVLLSSADYTATNGLTVSLARAAVAGDTVTFVAFYITSVANALSQAGGSITGNLTIGGTEIVNGNLGVGTSLPDSKLHAVNAAGAAIHIGYASTTQNKYEADTHTFSGASALTNSFVANQYGIGLGTTVPTSGRGIAFPASQSASSDPNTLDDYEEGTWTPSCPVSISTTANSYVKIGNTVYLNTFISVGTNSSASSMIITGIPYAQASGSSTVACFNATGTALVAYLDNNNIIIRDYSNVTKVCSAFSGSFIAFQVYYRT